jgi:ABC-type Fe3+-hydroxamate transport system substrate-binding protein
MGLRVVSLLPSATEIVCLVAAQCSADAAPQLVGRSHECDYPAGLAHLPVLTAAKTSFTDSADVDRQVREALSSGSGLYTVDRALLQQLQPDVIVTQSLCSVCSVDLCQVQRIAEGIQPPPRIIDLNPQNLEEVLLDVERVGAELGQPAARRAPAWPLWSGWPLSLWGATGPRSSSTWPAAPTRSTLCWSEPRCLPAQKAQSPGAPALFT